MTNSATSRSGDDGAGAALLFEIISGFQRQKQQAERALAQLDDSQWHDILDPDANSIAVLVRHIAGNLTSRWTDFLSSDGEKPSRDRDGEFEVAQPNPEQLMLAWNDAFVVLFDSLRSLKASDLSGTVTIRGEPLGVLSAILRSYDHTGHHVGQIVLLAKHWRGERWNTLSIASKRSNSAPRAT